MATFNMRLTKLEHEFKSLVKKVSLNIGRSSSPTSGGIQLDGESPETITKLWAGSQAQYDAIVSPDSNTLYYITS